ncbi:MAG TPA: pyridoxamine 5'-phosphate oxidase family protein [Sedimentisphaerales bacterium]|nr:pyridoxamine 5'-phosphate oxidase family protein [Sedimentisphaerales bacterium]
MTKEEVLEFATKNPVCSLATVDGNRPRVRVIMLYEADENGIIFCTGSQKAVHAQLQANPAAEMCFYNAEEGRMVRIEGTAETLDDIELKKKVVEKFTFLKPWVESQGYDVMVCYRLDNAKATTWTMETNFEPKQYIEL